MGASDALAVIGAVFFLLLILMPFIPGGPSLMVVFLGLLPFLLLVVLLIKVFSNADKIDELHRELERLREELNHLEKQTGVGDG